MINYELELQNTFIQIVGSLKKSMTHAMKDLDLDLCPSHFVVLRNIHTVENCTPNALAIYFRKDKAQITRLLKQLVKQELVSKAPNPDDKRSQLLTLTEKGVECFKLLEASDLKMLAGMKAGISDDELTQFLKIGAKMASNLDRDLLLSLGNSVEV